MGNAAFLLIPVVIVTIGLLVIGLKSVLDRPKPYDAMTDFQRGLEALSPHRRHNHDARSKRRRS